MIGFYLIFTLLPFIAFGEESCDRPKQLLEYEETCKTDPEVTGSSGTFLEQLQENFQAAVEQTRRLINVAKKKLGIKYDEEKSDEQIKKCEYYQCVFRKMDSLGSMNFPNMTLMENWINNNVDESMKVSALTKANSCFHAIAINIATDELIPESNFNDDIKMINPFDNTTDHDMEMAPEDKNSKSTPCDVSAKLMMCLHSDGMCSVFKYP